MPVLQEVIDDEIYAALDWTALVGAPTERHSPWALASKFFKRADAHEEAGELAHSKALNVLGGAISMHMRHVSHASFGPAVQVGDTRSMSMEDLGEHDIALLTRAALDAPNPWIRARFADLAVSADGSTPPNWRLGQAAVEAYLDYAASVFGTEWAIDGLDEVRRGLVLLRVYAKRDAALWDRYWSVILKEVPHAIANNWPGLVFRLCDEAVDRSREACEAIAPQLEAKAAELDGISPQQAADWHKHAHRLHRRLSRLPEANAALIAQGEAMARAAELSAEHQPILAPMHLSEAIRLLRQAKAAPSRIQELRDKLVQYERASLDHYGKFEHKLDVGDYVKWVEAQIAAPDFFSSLLRMAYRAGNWLALEDLEKRVRENAQKHPLSHMFSSTHANPDGVIISRDPPFDANNPTIVRQHMIQDAANFDLGMRASVMVTHATDFLQTSYQPSFQVIKEIVEASPITPPDQCESIARGLYAGFIDDWMAATVYLVPAMEPFVRMQLKRIGAHTMALNEDGTQHERTLGELLELPEAERFFGKNLVFELQVHLTEQDGFGLRNSYCHGLMSDRELTNAGIMSLWWVLWRMLLVPWHDHPAVLAHPPASTTDVVDN